MQYLEHFTLASADAEDDFVLSPLSKHNMSCYAQNVYPF